VFLTDISQITFSSERIVDHLACAEKLDFAKDASVDFIYSSHILEHYGRTEFMNVLREWHRVLKVGGTLRISVPDFRACAKIYYERGLEAEK
jgi:predicted SAM-dependent methyltransferase